MIARSPIDIVRAVARDRQLDVVGITSTSRCKWYLYARVEIANRLYADGYMPSLIGRILKRDHTTILYYIGRLQRRVSAEQYGPPKPPRERPKKRPVPKIVTVERQVLHRAARQRKYLVPYAGAEVWRERRHGR